MNVNHTLQPVVVLYGLNTTVKTLSWSSNHPEYATVDNLTGFINAVKPGEAVITANTIDGSNLTAILNITVVAIKITSLTINPTTYTLNKGNTFQPISSILPNNSTNQTLSWRTSNPYIAIVNNQTGLITGANIGTARITATTQDTSNIFAYTTIKVITWPILTGAR